MIALKKKSPILIVLLLLTHSLIFSGCSSISKKIAGGMLAGAVVGAGVGYQFVHHGEYRQYETQNTIITSLIFSLVTGGVLYWHYQEMEKLKVDISGRYARYRLCDPQNLPSSLSQQLKLKNEDWGRVYLLDEKQIGKLAISLDDNTKWVYPVFRKRYLLPESGENQIISKRYIWEIIKPGHFVTRSQNPQYFSQEEKTTTSSEEKNEKK